MKKIKLFALAVMAMLSTNAFAAGLDLGTTGSQTIGNVTYTVLTVYATNTATKINTVSARGNNFTAAALNIPETVTFNVQGDDSDGAEISKECTFNVVEIEENGFIDNTSINSVSLPANLVEIGAFAFEGCENLRTVTLAENAKLNIIGDGAFAFTSIATLDLSNATGFVVSPTVKGMLQFGWSTAATAAEQTGSPFISTKAGHTTNLMVKTVILPTMCAAINDGAFANCSNLATIDLAKVSNIGDDAFNGCAKLASVKIGTGITFEEGATNSIVIGATAFANCTSLTTVELGTLIDAADIDDDAFDKTGETNTKLTTFTFNELRGAIGTSSFNLPTVTTLNFNAYVGTINMVPDDAFTDAFTGTDKTKQTINYNITIPTGKAAVLFIQKNALAADGAAVAVTMKTIAAVELAYQATGIAKVEIAGGYSADETIGNPTTKKLVKDKNSNNYYYFYTANGDREILKTQESGAKVFVYQAYMDVADDEATAYFLPVQVVDGVYTIEDGETVIIKSDKEDGVIASTATTASSMVYNSSADVLNGLNNTQDNTYSLLHVQTDADKMNGGANDLWFFNNPATSGFGFTKFDPANQTGGLGKNCVWMVCDATSAARLNLVWLDEAEATAIKTVKGAKAENGAIYNLAGQKVNASYKGVVIKDGKKYIQK